MAVDRKKIAEVILKNAIPVANGILMPGVPGYTPDDKTYPYDPTAGEAAAGAVEVREQPAARSRSPRAAPARTVGPTTRRSCRAGRTTSAST